MPLIRHLEKVGFIITNVLCYQYFTTSNLYYTRKSVYYKKSIKITLNFYYRLFNTVYYYLSQVYLIYFESNYYVKDNIL